MPVGLPAPRRRARPTFGGNNGFTEPMAPENAHRHALYILEKKGITIDFTQIDEDLRTEETSQSLQEEIEKNKLHHTEELGVLCDTHAFHYLDEAKSRYLSKDPTQIIEIDHDMANNVYESHFRKMRQDDTYWNRMWSDDIERCSHAHYSRTLPLQQHLQQMHFF